jgi:hypothetical protein
MSHTDDHDKPLPDVLLDVLSRERMSLRRALRQLGGAGMLLSPIGWASVGCGDDGSEYDQDLAANL